MQHDHGSLWSYLPRSFTRHSRESGNPLRQVFVHPSRSYLPDYVSSGPTAPWLRIVYNCRDETNLEVEL